MCCILYVVACAGDWCGADMQPHPHRARLRKADDPQAYHRGSPDPMDTKLCGISCRAGHLAVRAIHAPVVGCVVWCMSHGVPRVVVRHLSCCMLPRLQKELEGFGLRLNKRPPNISFQKKDKGGVNFTSIVRSVQHAACNTQQHVYVRAALRCR